MKSALLLLVLFFVGSSAISQQIPMASFKPKKGVVCYGDSHDAPSYVPPPDAFLKWQENSSERGQAATFNVTYTGFTQEAQASFQRAVDIWSALITSPVTINITAEWLGLGVGVLGGASAGTYFRDFKGTQHHLIWHPVALQKKLHVRI
ncbi:MAG: hypothetical protein HC811_08960 [Flammeovirgaceae bacterium]|nr:hypothetical protein [Flammeovirgaceae bacterium]